jgi:shikimate kinase
VPFADLDKEIEAHTGLSIPDIFSIHGEDWFREVEAIALHTVAGRKGPTVVACGGGTPCFGHNIERMKATGTVVWLVDGIPAITQRLQQEAALRPLLIGDDRPLKEKLEKLLSERLVCYTQADVQVELEGVSVVEGLERLVGVIG